MKTLEALRRTVGERSNRETPITWFRDKPVTYLDKPETYQQREKEEVEMSQ